MIKGTMHKENNVYINVYILNQGALNTLSNYYQLRKLMGYLHPTTTEYQGINYTETVRQQT